jgi:hypothetical protein
MALVKYGEKNGVIPLLLGVNEAIFCFLEKENNQISKI